MLAESDGIFTDTAGGVVVSGLKELVDRGLIKSEEVTVAYITGNGLKTLEVVQDLAKPIITTADYKSVQQAMGLT